MVSKKLRAAIDEFKTEFSKYSTQAGAQYQCCDATDEFIRFCHRKGATELNIRRFEFDIKDSTGIYPSVYKDGNNESGHSRADVALYCGHQERPNRLDSEAVRGGCPVPTHHR